MFDMFKLPLFTNINDMQICREDDHKQLQERSIGAYMCTALGEKQIL